MEVKDFFYELPPELIAQYPLEERDSCRLMAVDKATGKVSHRVFSEVLDYLSEGDCLVLNDTRVIPGRLIGEKEFSGGRMEFLLLKRIDANHWETLVKPGKKAKIGARFSFGEELLKAEVTALSEDGSRIVRFEYEGIFEEILDRLGQMPLPPYITETLKDRESYQTVYSRNEGSAAAPTAGLHFTKELLRKIHEKGVKTAYLTLHVGLGTFRPVKVEKIEDHHMHSEYYSLSEEAAEIINKTKENGKKVIAVGTTSTRTIETIADEHGKVRAQSGWTDIFIYPGYKFKIVDGLITNFHLPESTLMMLVSALSHREIIMEAYKKAVEEKYRFFSFGDAMIII